MLLLKYPVRYSNENFIFIFRKQILYEIFCAQITLKVQTDNRNAFQKILKNESKNIIIDKLKYLVKKKI